jgi:alpha-1,3-rhamnosyltransferase
MNNPLVSVVVVTYNSSATIIETLESIKNQTYNNIELVVSDDASKDDTVIKVRNWIKVNKEYFQNAFVVCSEFNQGVVYNANQGIDKANGEWIKSIAGDDLLSENAIEVYVKESINSNLPISFAKMKAFGPNPLVNDNVQNNLLEKMYKSHRRFPNMTHNQIYRQALTDHLLPGPGLFYKKSFFYSVGKFNTSFPMTEESDFQLRVYKSTKVHFIDEYLVLWRQRSDSLSHVLGRNIYEGEKSFYEKVKRPELIKNGMYLYMLDKKIGFYIWKKKIEGNSSPLFLTALKCLSPYRWKKKIFSKLKID